MSVSICETEPRINSCWDWMTSVVHGVIRSSDPPEVAATQTAQMVPLCPSFEPVQVWGPRVKGGFKKLNSYLRMFQVITQLCPLAGASFSTAPVGVVLQAAPDFRGWDGQRYKCHCPWLGEDAKADLETSSTPCAGGQWGMYFSLCTLVANISNILSLCCALSPQASTPLGETGHFYFVFHSLV